MGNPGLQHIGEKILFNLDKKCLTKKCQNVNDIWESIILQPTFWLRKRIQKGLSKQQHLTWTKLIQELKNPYHKAHITAYLKKSYEKDEHCFPGWTPIQELCDITNGNDVIAEIIGKLAPLIENPNAPYPGQALGPARPKLGIQHFWEQGDKYLRKGPGLEPVYPYAGWTPIQIATERGNTEIIRILAPLSDRPNAVNPKGYTPIFRAAMKRYHEVIEILAPLSDNFDEPEPDGFTPIQFSATEGDIEIIKLLVPLSKNPNAPDPYGFTPIQVAASWNHAKVLKYLAP